MNEKTSLSGLFKRFYLQNWGVLLTTFLVILLAAVLWPVLAPFVAAFVLAYLLANPAEWLHHKLRRKVPLSLCAISIFVVVLLVIAGIVLLFIPVVSAQLELIQNNLPQLLVNLKARVLPWINHMFGLNLSIDSSALRGSIAQYVNENRGVLASLSSKVLRASSQSVLGLTGFVSLMVIATLFILPGWQSIREQSVKLLPPHLRTRTQPFFTEIDTMMTAYVKGVLIVILFLSTFYSIGLSLVGIQAGWAIGILAGLLSLIPYLGLTIAMVIGVLTALLELQGFLPVLLVLLVFGMGQLLEGFVLTPLVVGDKIGLSPLAVIFALTFFGALFGLAGMFLALPLAAICKVVYSHLFVLYSQSDYYRQGEA